MKSKGVTGKILTTIISLIVGMIALALLWLFLKGGTDAIIDASERVINALKCKFLCHGLFGWSLGFCSGC